MSRQRNQPSRKSWPAITLSLCLLLAASAADSQQAPTVITTESNLILVPVVVRDSQGKPITGLTRDDFKLFDRGKEQTITQFDAIRGPGSAPSPGATASQSEPTSAAPAQTRLVAFYFDNLNAPAASLMRSRDAADKFITTHLQPTDKVAIFSSDKLLTDFTSDAAKIHQALAQLNSSAHAKPLIRRCPDLSEYQAQEIVDSGGMPVNGDLKDTAWKLAGDEIKQCSGSSPNEPLTAFQMHQISAMAGEVLAETQARTRSTFDQLDQVVKYISHLQGERTLILVSPGFVSNSEQYRLDSLIDKSLRTQVVINVLDPKGLAVMMREQDASQRPVASSEQAIVAATTLDSHQAFITGDVLAELTQGTGGRLFHNDNDLDAGFNSLAGHPDAYVLAFSPKDLKRDGKLHELKVTLATKQKGIAINARKSYFASEEHAAVSLPEQTTAPQQTTVITPVPPAIAPPAASATGSPAAGQIEDTLKQAVLANNDSTDLPIEVEVEQTATEVKVLMHLDAHALPFRKDGDHSIDAVTFAAAIFDSGDKVGEIKQRSAKLNLTADQLAGITANGINLTFTFPAEAGAHRVRAVVTESEQHKIGSVSKALGAH